MSKKRQAQRTDAPKTRAQIATHKTGNAKQNTRQLAPVAVLTITYLPPLNQIANIQPQFPAQMSATDVLHILRRAEETLISRLTLEQSKADASTDAPA